MGWGYGLAEFAPVLRRGPRPKITEKAMLEPLWGRARIWGYNYAPKAILGSTETPNQNLRDKRPNYSTNAP
jgi:hypothetical protein